MRAVRYNVVSSLDGYIAGPNGEYDWIPNDPTVDFAAIFARFDTFLLGRATYDLVRSGPAPPWPAGSRVYVFSSTLRAEDHPGVTIVGDDAAARVVAELRAESGLDILAVRRRCAIRQPARRRAGRCGGGDRRPGTPGRRHPAASPVSATNHSRAHRLARVSEWHGEHAIRHTTRGMSGWSQPVECGQSA